VRRVNVLGFLVAALAVSGCAQNAEHLNTTYLDRYGETSPRPAAFIECHGFSCSEVSRVSLSPAQWRKVAAVFKPSPANAQAERRRISQAVAQMQLLVGAQTGTSAHQWTHKDMNILPNLSDPTQLDCIDEAVNTWTYMTMMEKAKLFRFHRVAKLSNGGNLHDPRNTAVVEEIGGDHYAIDPALVDVGVPPPVIPLASWIENWPPDASYVQASARVDAPIKVSARVDKAKP
jgi:hypothetical protein